MAKAVEDTDLQITNVFLKVVETIKATMVPAAVGVAPETEDEILSRIVCTTIYFIFNGQATSSQLK